MAHTRLVEVVNPQLVAFVAGLHRSGTTALARTLAQHPQVSGFHSTEAKEDEGQHLQDVYPPARAHGGAGRFAMSPAAHLTETSPLATVDSARRLMEQWGPHWDLTRPVLLEKSPPNLVMTRFLQALFPTARFVVVIRHPAVVALSTARWRRRSSVQSLLSNWLVAHETFLADSASLHHVHLLRYEDLVVRPRETLDAVGGFLGLVGPVPVAGLESDRSDGYLRRWDHLTGRGGLRGRRLRTVLDRLEPQVAAFGYSLRDPSALGPLPGVGALAHDPTPRSPS